jgi:hypothetical protein
MKIARMDLPVSLLIPHEDNPNKMNSREFDLLVDNLQQAGFTDPVLVWPGDVKAASFVGLYDVIKELPDDDDYKATVVSLLDKAEMNFKVIGGHHRIEAAKYLGWDWVPATIIIDETFTQEMADMQLLRHNTIHGALDAEKFVKLYDKYKSEYPDELLQEMFGFSDDKEFQRLIQDTADSLPPEIKEKFQEASQDIKSIDELSSLLNHLFNTYGDTLKHGYMILDQGGQKSVWLRMSKTTMDSVLLIGESCIQAEVTMDQMFGKIVQLMASGEAAPFVKKVLEQTPKANIPPGLAVLPTEDNLETVEEITGE